MRERVVCVACERERESGVCGEGGGRSGLGSSLHFREQIVSKAGL